MRYDWKNTSLVYSLLPSELLNDKTLKKREKIFLGMIQNAGQRGLCMNNRNIGKIVGMNITNACRMITRLERAGWILIVDRTLKKRRIRLTRRAQIKIPYYKKTTKGIDDYEF